MSKLLPLAVCFALCACATTDQSRDKNVAVTDPCDCGEKTWDSPPPEPAQYTPKTKSSKDTRAPEGDEATEPERKDK